MQQFLILTLTLFTVLQLDAQEIPETEKKGFVIVASGKNYDAMKILAKTVAEKMDYKLDLRDLVPDETLGLTLTKEDCENENYEFPWYIARGRYDDGEYVSIEYTDGYNTFTPGYYIIIVSSHSKGNKDLTKALNKAKQYYETAYIKYADVYMGCMH